MTPIPPFLAPEKSRFLPVPDALREAFFPAKVCLFEWTDYWFEWRGATHLRVGGSQIEPFAPHLFRVRWENALGASSIQPFRGETAIDEPLFVEIISPKFPTPDAHLRFFRALLDELFALAAPLIYHVEGETSRGVETSDLAPSPLWTRLFLEQNHEKLVAALRFFLAQPRRELSDERLWLLAAQATQFDGAALRETARDGSVWTRPNGQLTPQYVAQSRAREQIDTPHNRFVAEFARRLTLSIESPNFPEIRGLCAAVSARFPAWNDEKSVSPARFPTLSRRQSTRDLLALWQKWRGAGAPLFAPFERAARVRDIAQLYEFWTFFALCDQIGAVLEQKPRLEMALDDARGLKSRALSRFGGGTLVFNGPAPSYSTPLRPDFLWLENGGATLAFDAKFRLESPSESHAQGNSQGKSRGAGADLHKMHAYRDALGVRGAVAIHPGADSVFFARSGAKTAFSLRDLLHGGAQGVGLWALRPAPI